MAFERREVRSPKLNKPLGVFAQANTVRTSDGTMVFVSGLTSRAPDGSVVGIGDITVQTETILRNLQHVLAEAGGTLENVARVTVYIRNMEDFKKIHAVRERFFKPPYPASTMVEVSKLVDAELLIEIEAIAFV